MPSQHGQLPARNRIPDARRPILRRGDNALAVRTVSGGHDFIAVRQAKPWFQHCRASSCLVAGSNHRGLHIYRVADGAEVWRFNDMHKAYCAAFSPDGKHLAATDDEGGVYLWDIKGELDVKEAGK